jgi:CHAT domain-containing protein
VLAPGGGETGFVSSADLARLQLNADLVVLSSCRSAGGVVISGEGVQGLTAPLLRAGARSVLATQWEIGDRSAARFVESFYRQMARREPAGEALHRAKLEAIRAGMAPRDWAAFVIVGDPLIQVPLHSPHWWDGIWPLALFLVVPAGLLSLYLFRIRRRRSSEAS